MQGSFGVNYVNSKTINFDGGAKADINGDMGWLVSFGYNLSENLALDLDLGWSSVSYTGTRIEQGPPVGQTQYGGRLDTTSTHFNLTYYFMTKTFTPFVSANIGGTWIDSDIPVGPPVTGCWWDPWYGQLCGPYQPTYANSEFTYGAGLGLRYDARNNVFVRGTIGQQWLDISSASGTPDFTMYRIDLGLLLGK